MGVAISRTALSAVAICGSALWAVAGYLLSEGEGKQTANPGIRYYKNGSVCDAYEAPFCERKSTKFVCFFLLLVKVDGVSFFFLRGTSFILTASKLAFSFTPSLHDIDL